MVLQRKAISNKEIDIWKNITGVLAHIIVEAEASYNLSLIS